MVRKQIKSKKFKNVISTMTIALLIFSMITPFVNTGRSKVISDENIKDSNYTVHAPIRVDSDTDFNESVWDGNGTENDPYVLDNYSIDGGGHGYCVYVGNVTEKYFVIENCNLYNASGGNGNFYFSNSGIIIYGTSHSVMKNNTISTNTEYGVTLKGDTYNNACKNKLEGNKIFENNIGIGLLSNSPENFISNNTIENNNQTGLELNGSDSNTIIHNTINGNSNGTLFRSYPNDNLFHHNNFVNKINVNVNAIGDNTWDNGTHGNYWSDYEGNDSDGDGIGNDNYNIDSNNKDGYPLMIPIDEQPPVIKNINIAPTTQNLDFPVNISCTVNDLEANKVWTNISTPDNSNLNLSMNRGTDNNWYLNRSYNVPGTFTFQIIANDTNDNLNRTTQFEFEMIDEVPPQIEDQTTSLPKTGENFKVNASITDNHKVNTSHLFYEMNSTEGYSYKNTVKMNDDQSKNIPIWDNATELSYQINATDCSENENSTVLKMVNVTDNIQPQIEDVTIYPDKQLIHNPVNISATIHDNIEIENASINFSTPITGEYEMQKIDEIYYYNTTYSINGTYKFVIESYDINGNCKIISESNFKIGDHLSPTVDITKPGSEDIITTSDPTVEWEGCDSESSISHYSINLDDNEWINVGCNESFEFNNLKDGKHNVTVKAFDQYNNTSLDKISFTIDTYSPELEIISPKNNSILNSKEIKIKWNGSDNNTGIYRYGLNIDNYGWYFNGDFKNFSYSFNKGLHNIQVKAIDNAGLITIESIDFKVDTDKPSIDIKNINNNSIFNHSQITIKWEGEDRTTSVQDYYLKIDNNEVKNMNLNTSYSESFSEGKHSVKITAKDKADNTNNSVINFTIDQSPPELDILSPTNEFVNRNNITINWTGNDTITDIKNYKIKLDEDPIQNIGLDTSFTKSFKEGKHSVRVIAEDKAGNSCESMIDFTVDRSYPELDILAPSDNHIAADKVTVKWTGNDSITAIDSYKIKINKNPWITIGKNTSYLISEEKAYNISIKALDLCGHITKKTVNFTLNKLDMDIELEVNKGKNWSLQRSIPININTVGEDTPAFMRISLNDDFSNESTGWIEYNNKYNYTIPYNSGKYTIHCQFKDSEETKIISLNKSIFVDLKNPSGEADINKILTSDSIVNISLEGQDDIDTINKVMISENSNFTPCSIKPYSDQISYEISSDYGEKSIFVKFVTTHGQMSETFEVSTFLDNKGPDLTYLGKHTIKEKDNLTYNMIWKSNDYSGNDRFNLYNINDHEEKLIKSNINSKEFLYNLSDNSTYKFKLRAFDNLGNSNFTIFQIETNINYPPTLENVDVPSVIKGTSKLKVEADDCNNDNLTILWYDGDSKIGEGSEIKPDLEKGEHDIKVVITDGTNKKEKTFEVSVKKSNDDPTFSYILISGILLTLIIGGLAYIIKSRKSKTTEEEFNDLPKREYEVDKESEVIDENDESENGEESVDDIDEDDIDLFGV